MSGPWCAHNRAMQYVKSIGVWVGRNCDCIAERTYDFSQNNHRARGLRLLHEMDEDARIPASREPAMAIPGEP